ncbi:hypothetical protein [Paraburkholderia sp. BL10I2N1]|uniref:hypothetical protein n=1 Tax=Paraburkholderia sp. BL10I2N1 TaxID=1938796 RepID=UPI0010611441|nr:hypothetical protein [Paraburkholderia sp. BL10I2N1]TDN69214.1 hypothetical protein B0G77_2590 [Paraburkholderia sp. BL10I2N1]
MPYFCENVECRAVLARGQIKAICENEGFCFHCPDCEVRNELNIGLPGGPVELVQPERSALPHKVTAAARPLEDGRYAAHLSIQKALGMKGPYAVEEHWEQLGVFRDAQDAVAHAKSVAADWLDRKA